MSREQYKNKCLRNETIWNENNRNAIKLFYENKISINRLYDLTMFEKCMYRVEFFGIMNIYTTGKIESGKLIKINGNYDYLSNIHYLNNSVIQLYKVRYYFSDGTTLLNTRYLYDMKWSFDQINRLFNLELIGLFFKYLRGTKRRRFVSLLKCLIETRYSGLELNKLIDYAS